MDKEIIEIIEVPSFTSSDVGTDGKDVDAVVRYHESALEYARELVKLVKTLTLSGTVHGEFSIELLKELEELFIYLETHFVAM